jgi:vacuolar-type H+-ATPase catalytic subunit A/Vma1
MKKQYLMLNAIGRLFLVEKEAVDGGAPVSNFQGIKAKEMLAKMKFVKDDEMETYIRQYEKALGEVLTRK